MSAADPLRGYNCKRAALRSWESSYCKSLGFFVLCFCSWSGNFLCFLMQIEWHPWSIGNVCWWCCCFDDHADVSILQCVFFPLGFSISWMRRFPWWRLRLSRCWRRLSPLATTHTSLTLLWNRCRFSWVHSLPSWLRMRRLPETASATPFRNPLPPLTAPAPPQAYCATPALQAQSKQSLKQLHQHFSITNGTTEIQKINPSSSSSKILRLNPDRSWPIKPQSHRFLD